MTQSPTLAPVTAVVLCGGTSERMGGIDKTAEAFGAGTVLDRILDGLPRDWDVVCVGTERPTHREVHWTQEEPPLGGPAAGIATGAAISMSPLTVVIAGDQPFAADAAADVVSAYAEVCEVEEGFQGVGLVDASGRMQPLLACYETAALRRAFPPGTRDASVHRTAASLRLYALSSPTTRALLDVDTPDDLAAARAVAD